MALTPPAHRSLDHPYSAAEEVLHVATHGLGALLSLAGLAVLLPAAARTGDPWKVAGTAVYGVTLFLLYLGSTLYHSARSSSWRRTARTLDHSSIYLLIAGTYTPFTLVTLRGAWGRTLFGIVWGLAALGIARETLQATRRKWLSVILYLAMGWVVVVAAGPLVERLPAGGVRLLVAGGLAYTVGAVFYGLKRIPYMHAVWHLFVLAGSVAHFFAVAFYVVGV
ncbi:MAG: PAQR family membrane homeostasis protein TrhA [Deferrisomatales bacterium]